MSANIFKKRKSHLIFLGVRWVMWSKFPRKDTEILGATVQNLVIMASWCSWFSYMTVVQQWKHIETEVKHQHLNLGTEISSQIYASALPVPEKCQEKLLAWWHFSLLNPQLNGFGGLEVACWPLVPNFAGSNPAEAVGFFRAKKSSDPWMLRGSRAFSGKIHGPFLAQVVPPFTTRVSGGDTWRCN